MKIIEPIDVRREAEVIATTRDYIDRGEQLFQRRFDSIPVLFDLRGRSSGMYRVRGTEAVIRYNPWLFAKYYEESLANTVPHEVAHYLVDRVYGLGRTRPHGREWQAVMQALGAEPRRTADYNLDSIPQRQHRQFSYRCDCRSHQLGSVRHKRIKQRRARYHCRSCGGALRYCG